MAWTMEGKTLSRVDLDAPFGPVVIAESDDGVVAVELGAPSADAACRRIEARLGSVRWKRAKRSAAREQIGEYLAGDRREFDVQLDLSTVAGFRREVLLALQRVRFGKLLSYGDLAASVGRPGAARAVGGAMAQNPIPILVPCHRVIAADGSLGGFSGGLHVKRWLHRHEGIAALSGGWEAAAAR